MLQQLMGYQDNEGAWVYDSFKVDGEVYLLHPYSKGYLLQGDRLEKDCPEGWGDNLPLPITHNGKVVETVDEVMAFVTGCGEWHDYKDYVFCNICHDYQKKDAQEVAECGHVFFEPKKAFFDGCGAEEGKFKPELFIKLAKAMKGKARAKLIRLIKEGGKFSQDEGVSIKTGGEEFTIPKSGYGKKNYRAAMWLMGAETDYIKQILEALESVGRCDYCGKKAVMNHFTSLSNSLAYCDDCLSSYTSQCARCFELVADDDRSMTNWQGAIPYEPEDMYGKPEEEWTEAEKEGYNELREKVVVFMESTWVCDGCYPKFKQKINNFDWLGLMEEF